MPRKSKFIWDAEDAAGLVIIPPEGLPLPEEPRSLKGMHERAYRRTLLNEPHMAPLKEFVEQLRREDRGFVPNFDPLDGGTGARLLFLMEKPGPKTDEYVAGGSGFISRDNDDQSAAATFTFMRQARIPREDVAIWNSIPWWNGIVKTSPEERSEGLLRLEPLLELLPRLQGVVLVGQKASRAANILALRNLKVWHSAHPSPRVRARYPDQHAEIPRTWAAAAASLS